MNQNFSENIDQFSRRRKEIGKSLNRFRMWLRRNNLFEKRNDQHLSRLKQTLEQEDLTIAFVGEFSRGKTELINALFFTQYGQRILHSEVGRTTMCPTELFYDKEQQTSYLRLLPIETRLQRTSLIDYRKNTANWVEIKLNTDSAQQMSVALQRMSETKQVSIEQAKKLGFDADMLQPNMQDKNQVEVPKWRHAMVSFDHPLLKQGLRILDTPGLNALGSEPELTLKLLPQVQAILFLLSADTGVTASDMKIWEQHIQNIEGRSELCLYAVLNKIDTLWDELSSPQKVELAIQQMTQLTARQLQIDESQVLPVSAQKSLVAKVKNDPHLLAKSRMEHLEQTLSTRLIQNKEKHLLTGVIEESQSMIRHSLGIVNNQRDHLVDQQTQFESITDLNKEKINALIKNNDDALDDFRRKTLSVKPSQRLLQRQARILHNAVSNDTLAKEVEVALDELVNSKTTYAMYRQMQNFFVSINGIMAEFSREAELTNKMALSLYKKFAKDFDIELIEPRLFPVNKLNRRLQKLILRSEKIDKNLLMTFSEHSVAIKRFFSGSITDILDFFKTTRHDLIDWTKNILNPINQQLKIQNHLILSHRDELLKLRKHDANIEGKLKAIHRLLDDVEIERDTGLEILHSLDLQKPAPIKIKKPSNIVPLSSAAGRKA